MMKVLFETDYVLITYCAGQKLLSVKWKKEASEKTIALVYHHTIKAFKLHFINTLVNDFSNAGILQENDLNWIGFNVMPMLVKCGMRNIIVVADARQQEQYYSDFFQRVAAFVQKDLHVAFYTEWEEALRNFNITEGHLYNRD